MKRTISLSDKVKDDLSIEEAAEILNVGGISNPQNIEIECFPHGSIWDPARLVKYKVHFSEGS